MTKPNLFIGLNKGAHDAGLCLIDDRGRRPRTELLLKERWTRVKADGHDVSPLARIVLPIIRPDRVVLAESSFLGRPEPVEQQLDRLGGYFDYLRRSGIGFFSARFNPELRFLPHHYCHAMAAAAVSPFKRSLILVFDGAGSSPRAFDRGHVELSRFPPPKTRVKSEPVAEALTVYLQDGPDLHCVHKEWQALVPFKKDDRVRLSDGLGMFYENAALFIFNSRRDSGKVMALAPFGRARPVSGRAQFYRELDWSRAFRGRRKDQWQSSLHFQYYADIAASVQSHFESSLLELLRDLRRRRPEFEDIIMTGGCALNCVANSLVASSKIFRRVYVPPFPSDESIAFGAAQHLRFHEGRRRWAPTHWTSQRADLGWSGSRPEGRGAVWVGARVLRNPEREAAKLLAQGKILGWFQGRSECGPRALGYRSILASPLARGVKDRLNRRIKRREDFRPYGCSVLWEKAAEYFEIERGFDSPFMSFAPKVRPEFSRKLREVTHIDGTSRIQTVRRSQYPSFHRLLCEFGRRTGLFAVLNTSLNVMGEPIVETVEDARRFFELVPVDAMIVGDRLIERRGPVRRAPVAGDSKPHRGSFAWEGLLAAKR